MAGKGKVSRMNQVRNNPPKTKQDESSNNGAETPEEKGTAVLETVKGTEEQYLAVALHQAREDKNKLRQQLHDEQKLIVELQTQVGVLKQTVLKLEQSFDEQANTRLREEQKFVLGASIRKDHKTGEIRWVPTPPAPTPI